VGDRSEHLASSRFGWWMVKGRKRRKKMGGEGRWEKEEDGRRRELFPYR